MEKVTLKPIVKELIHKSGEENVHFDVLSYQGAGNQEKNLGSLFVLGHIKYSQEDLSYAVSLISSLAKREYYSEQSILGQNGKKAFEHTLKKLNEVLDDFFQNKNFKLDIGLAAISGDNIYISRLGKFKIALARDGKYIDILNNVDLFSKDTEGEKQFSNIISGKMRANDKIFAYIPFRSITSREKQLNTIFVKENQDGFGQKIAHLAANANNFSCCGIHIDLQEIKEIPVLAPSYKKPILQAAIKDEPVDIKTGDTDEEKNEKESSVEYDPPRETAQIAEETRIIPAELSVNKRSNIFTPVWGGLRKLTSVGRSGERARRRIFIAASVLVIAPILVFALLRTGDDSSATKNTLKQVGENLKLAQSHITQNNPKEARLLLQASLISLTDITGKKSEETKLQINQALDGLDLVNDKQPVLFTDLSALTDGSDQEDQSEQTPAFNALAIAGLADGVIIANSEGALAAATQDGISELGERFKTVPKFLFAELSFVSVFNGIDTLGTYDMAEQKLGSYTLEEAVPAKDAALYENNLYVLSDSTIFKYADAAAGRTKRTVWASDDSSGNLISLAIDGNIFALTDEGKLIKYFKSQKENELDLRLIPPADSRILIFKDSPFVYLADKTNKRIHVFDKETGTLKTTYKLDSVGTVSDISVSADGGIWILSDDNKVWRITP